MSQAKSDAGGTNYDLTNAVTTDYHSGIVKPTMVAEHRYESGIDEDPIIQRRSLYLSVFAGAFGYAYGHNALWQMTPHTAQPWMLKGWNPGVKEWKQALHTAAAQQLHHIKILLYNYSYLNRIPDQSLILAGQGDNITNRVQVMRNGHIGNTDASYIMAYLSTAQAITIKTTVLAASKLNAYWFDPRTEHTEILKWHFKNSGILSAEKKTGGQDWVLVITDRDASKTKHLPFTASIH
ncbi:MAG: DUF4038 domain-containing protein [Bacteroidota bacterium]